MAKFDASNLVETLDYTFAPFVPDAVGLTPEPNLDQIGEFWEEYAQFQQEVLDTLGKKEGESDEEYASRAVELQDHRKERDEASLRRRAAIYAKLCSGQPSADEIYELGRVAPRIERLFEQAMLTAISPEIRAADTNP